MPVASIASPPTLPDASVREFAEIRTTSKVEMGYSNCRMCGCTAYVEPYDGTNICATCKHNYDDHW